MSQKTAACLLKRIKATNINKIEKEINKYTSPQILLNNCDDHFSKSSSFLLFFLFIYLVKQIFNFEEGYLALKLTSTISFFSKLFPRLYMSFNFHNSLNILKLTETCIN